MILAEVAKYSDNVDSVSLSQMLRMYYSEHGFFNPEFKACNRHVLYSTFKNKNSKFYNNIKTNALNYMYAYQDYLPALNSLLGTSKYTYEEIKALFEDALDKVLTEFDSFLGMI